MVILTYCLLVCLTFCLFWIYALFAPLVLQPTGIWLMFYIYPQHSIKYRKCQNQAEKKQLTSKQKKESLNGQNGCYNVLTILIYEFGLHLCAATVCLGTLFIDFFLRYFLIFFLCSFKIRFLLFHRHSSPRL